MAAQLYLFRTPQAEQNPVFGLRNGIVAAVSNQDDVDTDAVRLANVITKAAEAGVELPPDYFANGVPLTALATGTFAGELADAGDTLFFASRNVIKAEGP